MAAHSPFSRIPCVSQRMQSLLKPEEWYSLELTHAYSGHGRGPHPVGTPSKPVIFLWVKSARQLFARLLAAPRHSQSKVFSRKSHQSKEIFSFTFSQCRRILAISHIVCKYSCLNFGKWRSNDRRSSVQSPASGCKRRALSYLLPNLEIKRSH